MRRLLAIALLLLFGLPAVSPLFALFATTEAKLPACCRRGGVHRCMMLNEAAGPGSSATPGVHAPVQRCPYCPAAVTGQVHGETFRPTAAQMFFAAVLAHPAVVAQTESKLRVARARSRQKRGPPAPLLS